MLKFTLQNKRKTKNGSTSGSEAPGSPTSGSFTSSASSSSGQMRRSGMSGTVRRPSSLAPSDDSEGKSPSETLSTSQDSDLGSFTLEITSSHGNRGRKNVSFEPTDTVYMIESAHDSSSGIASDEQNSSPNGHTTSTSASDPTYGLPPSRPEPPSSQRFANDLVVANVSAGNGAYPNNPAFRDISPQAAIGYFRRLAARRPDAVEDRVQALSPRARLPAAPHEGGTPNTHCVQRMALNGTDGEALEERHKRTFSPLTTEEAILNLRNSCQYTQPPPGGATCHQPYTQPAFHAPHQSRHLKHPSRSLHNLALFDLLPDDVIIRILGNLSSVHLCRSARVCRRWYHLVWEPVLWTCIRLTGSELDADRALKVLTRRLSYDTPTVCVMVEKVVLSGCERLTDKGVHTIARRCPELRQLELQGCVNVSNIAVFQVVSKCVNMEHLNVSGCPEVTCICLTPEATVQAPAYGRQTYLHHLDMSDCGRLQDAGLQLIASFCPQLTFLYLRRCLRLTDIGVQYVANYCTNIREFSISDCRKVTDFGMRELAKLGPNLRYLSVAKCDKISDVGVRYIAQNCHKLRYLNVRGCPAVSDDAIELVAKYCKRLKSLDIGKCDVTDEGLQIVAENCPQLRRLSLKSCDAVTDRGVTVLAFYCRQLQQLNIQECQVSVESYRAVKKYCRRCIIEHTNPGFY